MPRKCIRKYRHFTTILPFSVHNEIQAIHKYATRLQAAVRRLLAIGRLYPRMVAMGFRDDDEGTDFPLSVTYRVDRRNRLTSMYEQYYQVCR